MKITRRQTLSGIGALLASPFFVSGCTPASRGNNQDPGVKNLAAQFSTHKFASKGGSDLYLNLFLPSSEAPERPRPLIIYSFGGGWQWGTRGDEKLADSFRELLNAGFSVAAIDYRLGIKEAKHAGEMTDANGSDMYLRAIQWGVEDLYDATRYLLDHADEFALDPTNFVAMGSSAGATNSLVAEWNLANGTNVAKKHLPGGFRYAGIIAMAGAFWLKAGTPLTFSSAPAPIMFFHGSKDWLVTYDEIKSPFAGYGPAYYFREFPGPDHPKWFMDYPEGDHTISERPLTNRTLEMRAFVERFVVGREKLSVHTIEVAKKTGLMDNLIQAIKQ